MSYRVWTSEEETLLKQLVDTGKYSYRQMEQFFPGRSLNSLTCHARQYLNIYNDKYESRKYIHNEEFFKEPNVLNSYIAGFLAADGCLKEPKTQAPILVLEVSIDDIDHLKMIKDSLGHTGPITSFVEKGRNTARFQISCDTTYAEHLKKNFGIIPKKSHHLTPPNLTNTDCQIAFLIGLLDGDGCVHIAKSTNQIAISFVSSSINAVKWVDEILLSFNFPLLKNKPSKIRSILDGRAYVVRCANSKAICLIKLVQSFAQKHNLPILKRKWNTPKINEYIHQFHQKYPNFQYNP